MHTGPRETLRDDWPTLCRVTPGHPPPEGQLDWDDAAAPVALDAPVPDAAPWWRALFFWRG